MKSWALQNSELNTILSYCKYNSIGWQNIIRFGYICESHSELDSLIIRCADEACGWEGHSDWKSHYIMELCSTPTLIMEAMFRDYGIV